MVYFQVADVFNLEFPALSEKLHTKYSPRTKISQIIAGWQTEALFSPTWLDFALWGFSVFLTTLEYNFPVCYQRTTFYHTSFPFQAQFGKLSSRPAFCFVCWFYRTWPLLRIFITINDKILRCVLPDQNFKVFHKRNFAHCLRRGEFSLKPQPPPQMKSQEKMSFKWLMTPQFYHFH